MVRWASLLTVLMVLGWAFGDAPAVRAATADAPQFAQAEPPPGAGPAAGRESFVDKFRRANVTNDGKLTLQQARAAGMHMVANHFAEIDTTHKGYVTMDDLRAARAAYQQRKQGKPPPPPTE